MSLKLEPGVLYSEADLEAVGLSRAAQQRGRLGGLLPFVDGGAGEAVYLAAWVEGWLREIAQLGQGLDVDLPIDDDD